MTDTTAALSFAKDIRPMFTQTDIDHMRAFMDLSSRDSVFEHADAIYETVSSGAMPPRSSGEPAWTPQMCATFMQWQSQGGPA
jgi:hypothetical protein